MKLIEVARNYNGKHEGFTLLILDRFGRPIRTLKTGEWFKMTEKQLATEVLALSVQSDLDENFNPTRYYLTITLA